MNIMPSENPVKFRYLNLGDVVKIPGQAGEEPIVVVDHAVRDGKVVSVDLQVQHRDGRKPGAAWPITGAVLDEKVERVG